MKLGDTVRLRHDITDSDNKEFLPKDSIGLIDDDKPDEKGCVVVMFPELERRGEYAKVLCDKAELELRNGNPV